MSYSIRELRAVSDDDLIEKHDAQAKNTSVGVDYYLEELNRRSRERATDASNKLAARSFWLSVVSSITSVAALVVAVIAILIG